MEREENFLAKNKYFMIFLVFVLALAVFAWAIWLIGTSSVQPAGKIVAVQGKTLTDEEITFLNEFDQAINSEDRLVYNVSSNTDGPRIYKVIIAPEKVARGQTQYLEVWVKDETGVKSVFTDTELDYGATKHLDMELYDGDSNDGRWRASWEVHDTHDETYNTVFTAVSTDDRDTIVSYGWLDPACSPPLTGTWTIPAGTNTCNQGGYVGTDGGNVVLGLFANLRIDPGTTVVFTPGQSITLGLDASISLNGGEIKKGYIYVLDKDSDGVTEESSWTNAMKSFQTSTSGEQMTNNIRYINYGPSRFTRQADLGKLSLNDPDGDCGPSDINAEYAYPGQEQYVWGNFFNTEGEVSGDFDCNGTVDTGLAGDSSGPKSESQVFLDYSWISYSRVPPPPGECYTYQVTGGEFGVGCGGRTPAVAGCTIGQGPAQEFLSFLQEHFASLLIHPALALTRYDVGFWSGTSCSGFCVGDTLYKYCR